MEDLSQNGSITYRAIQQSRPGPRSWLALLLFIGSLLLAVEFRGTIVDSLVKSLCRSN